MWYMCFTLSLVCLTLVMHFWGPWKDFIKVVVVLLVEVLLIAIGVLFKLFKKESWAKYGILVELIPITVSLFVQSDIIND